jgi:hypothetical protein
MGPARADGTGVTAAVIVVIVMAAASAGLVRA